ncbi:MAG TPA: hypothetical protein VLD37_00685 [Candidatus Bilamarchaeum sp.]|nr:hypothetical protein [Candidatus Bilamarchaeum sp.]
MAVPGAGNREIAGDYEEQITELESETDSLVSETISRIESAIEAFRAAGNKPEEIREDMVRLRGFYDELCSWEKRSLSARRGGGVDAKVKRLQEFVDICTRYSGAFGRTE